jgi:hypothetical protein
MMKKGVKLYDRRRLEGGEITLRLILDMYIYADYLYKGLQGWYLQLAFLSS